MELKPIAVTDFRGLIEAVNELVVDPGAARAMTNVVLTDTNSMKSRDGYTAFAPGAEQAYFTRAGDRAFFTNAGVLSEMMPDGSTRTLANIPAGRIFWEEMGEQIILSGPVYGVIGREAFTEYPTQPLQPDVEMVSGELPAGEYIVAMIEDSTGIDSVSCYPVHTILGDNQGIAVTTPAVAGSYRVYVTAANGTVPYLIGTGTESQRFELSAPRFTGMALTPGLLDGADFPVCDRVAWFDSQVWRSGFDQSQDTTFIYPSEVFRPAAARLMDYLAIPGEVTALAGLKEGLLITTLTHIYLYNGNELETLARYGAPAHYHIARSDDGKAWIWSNEGLVRAAPFENLTREFVRDVPAQAVSTHRLRDPDGDQLVVMFEQTA